MRRLGDVGASLDGLVSFGAMCAGHLRGSVKTTVGCYHPCPTAADVPTPLSDDDARSCVVPFAPSATTTTTVYDAPTPSAVVDAALVDGDVNVLPSPLVAGPCSVCDAPSAVSLAVETPAADTTAPAQALGAAAPASPMVLCVGRCGRACCSTCLSLRQVRVHPSLQLQCVVCLSVPA
jgi:hypothetical protein